MANFERRELGIGPEFMHWSFSELKNYSEGSSEPKKDAWLIRVQGQQAHEFLNSQYLFFLHSRSWYHYSIPFSLIKPISYAYARA